MDLQSLGQLGWLGFLAPVALFYKQTKDFVVRVFKIFWKTREVPYDFHRHFYEELKKRSFCTNFDEYGLITASLYSKKRNLYLPIVFKTSHTEFFFYKKFIPIIVTGTMYSFSISYLKGTFAFEKFLSEIIAICHKQFINTQSTIEPPNRFFIEVKRGRALKFLKEEQGGGGGGSVAGGGTISNTNKNSTIIGYSVIVENKYQDLALGGDLNEFEYCCRSAPKDFYRFTEAGRQALNQVKKWLGAKEWYGDRNIAWRRGMMLHGKPGNGKSALILEIAKKCRIPLYIFDLASMDNGEFDAFLMSLPSEPAIVLVEDIDAIFAGRENITRTAHYGGLTFDCLINRLGGVNSVRNKFIFITTNHLNNVDPALLRPGRMDEVVEILPLNLEEKRELANIILDEYPHLIDDIVTEGAEDSTAEFENRCTRVALEMLWNGCKKEEEVRKTSSSQYVLTV